MPSDSTVRTTTTVSRASVVRRPAKIDGRAAGVSSADSGSSPAGLEHQTVGAGRRLVAQALVGDGAADGGGHGGRVRIGRHDAGPQHLALLHRALLAHLGSQVAAGGAVLVLERAGRARQHGVEGGLHVVVADVHERVDLVARGRDDGGEALLLLRLGLLQRHRLDGVVAGQGRRRIVADLAHHRDGDDDGHGGGQQRHDVQHQIEADPPRVVRARRPAHLLATGPTRSHFHESPPRIDRLPGST
jgi:hypothetical protein